MSLVLFVFRGFLGTLSWIGFALPRQSLALNVDRERRLIVV